jgi:hypothetical protein
MAKLKTIPVVNAKDIPRDAIDWLVDQEARIHHGNDIVQVEDDGNAFAEWLKSQGFVFEYNKAFRGNWAEIGILGT